MKVPRGSEWVALALYQDMTANDKKLSDAQALLDRQRQYADELETQMQEDKEREDIYKDETRNFVDQMNRDFEKYKEDVAREIQARHDMHEKQRLIWEDQVNTP